MKTLTKLLATRLASSLAILLALFAAQSAWADDVVDLGGLSVSTNATGFSDFKDKIIQNGTITMAEGHVSGATAGKYTIGSGATVKDATSGGPEFTGDWNFNVVDGGFYHQNVSSGDHRFIMPMNYGNCTFTLDNGAFTTDADNSSNNAEPLTLGWIWARNTNDGVDKDVSMIAVIRNRSTLSVPNGNIRIGGTRKDANRKSNTLKVDFAVTNSTMTVGNEIVVGCAQSVSTWLNYPENSYTKVTFGPGADITCKNLYARPNPSPSVTLDGATIRYAGTGNNSFIGHDPALGDVYTIQSNGLTIDIPSGKSLTCDADASSLKGEGGISKIGGGSITWNQVSSGGSEEMTFTGPLVVSNGTWTSTLGYAASAFRADGGTLVLSDALSAANVALAATEGGTLTLTGAKITDASPDLTLAGGGKTDYFTRDNAVGTYTLDSLTLGEDAVLDLDGNATAIDAISATTMNITATSANPATINIYFTAVPAIGTTFTLFETDSADKFVVNTKVGNDSISNDVVVEDGRLKLTIGNVYTWGGNQTNWGDADAWTKGGNAATWSNGGIALFSTDGAQANLAADAEAAKVNFLQNATISGSGTLTVPSVSVDPSVSATISAPTAGALTKTGAGTLTLGANRTDQTTLSEGTLAMSGATVDPALLTLGTDAAKPVVFDYGGQTLTAAPSAYLGPGMDVTLTNGTFTHTANVAFTDSNLPATFTIATNATLSSTGRFTFNSETERTINFKGSTLSTTATGDSGNNYLQNSGAGKLTLNFTEGATLATSGRYYAATFHEEQSLNAGATPELYIRFDNSSANISGKGICLGCYSERNSGNLPEVPVCELSVVNNSSFASPWGIGIGESVARNPRNSGKNAGRYVMAVTNSTVTTKNIHVYADRHNYVVFNGAKVVLPANSTNQGILAADDDYETVWTGFTPYIVDGNGLEIDTATHNGTVSANIGGTGAVTKIGAGKLTITKNQTASSVLNVSEGTVVIDGGVSVARPTMVASGATLTVNGTAEANVDTLTLAAGSTLNIASYTEGVTPLAVTTLTLPTEGTVALTLNGGDFGVGRYAILEKSGITVEDVQGKLVPSVGTLSGTFNVSGDTLNLVVKGENDVIWVGGASTDLATGANWLGGSVPSDTQNAVIGAPVDEVLSCSANFSPASITFLRNCPALTIGGENDVGEITGITSITNLSSNSHTINVPVRFAGNIQVSQNADYYDHISQSHIIFAGGAYAAEGCAIETGDTVNWSRCMFGKYYLANNSDVAWTATYHASCRPGVAENSELYVPYAGSLMELDVAKNAKVFVGDMTLEGRLMHQNYGEVVVTNLTVTGSDDKYVTYNQGTTSSSVFKFNSVTNKISNSKWFYFGDANASSKQTIFFGEGGVVFDDSTTGSVCFGNNNKNNTQTTVRPWYSNFTIGISAGNNNKIAIDHDVEFNTNDEDGTGRTITLNAITRARNSPTITVSGSGTLRVNKSNDNSAQPPVTVTNSATLAIKPGASLGTGATTVNDGATLAVAESGTVTLGGDLTLKAGAKLGFNFTDRATVPQLNLEGKTVTFDEGESTNIVVKISAEDGVWPSSGQKVLTSGGKFTGVNAKLDDSDKPRWAKSVGVEDGNIYVEVKPKGLMILVY